MTKHQKRNLVFEAIAHKDTGRVPFMILVQPTIGRKLAAYYGVKGIGEVVDNSVEWIGNALSVSRMEELGILENGTYTDEWGIQWHGVGETRGQVKAHPLKEPSLKGCSFPSGPSPEIIKQMKSQAEKCPHRYRVAKLGALWEQATFLRGMEDLLCDLVLHPQFVHELLDALLESLLAALEVYGAELDVECIWLSDDYGGQSGLLMSPEHWRVFIGPRLQRLCEAVKSTGHHFVLHSDGAIGPVIPDIAAMGVDILHPVQPECMDVLQVKREFGKDITLWGGYGTQRSLVFGSPAMIKREVNDLCDVMGAGGGFILSPGLSIQNEVPIENALAFIEVALARERLAS